MAFLKQSTSATIVMGPFVDSTDGFTPETALTINQANVRVSKNGGSFASKSNSTAASHLENGYYSVPIDTTDTGTLGRLTLVTSGVAGALPVWMEYNVVVANIYDSIITSGDYQEVDLVQWRGTQPNVLISNRVDANAQVVGDKTNYTVSSGSITAVAGNVTGSVGSVTGAVGSVTGNVGGNVVGSVASVTNPVSVSAQTNHPDVSVSAYTNFPQVYVSANGDKTGYSITANTDKTGYSITANSDKTGYTVTAGSITNVTGNVSGSVNNLVVNPTITVGEVTVSAYKNFPQVSVSANSDKTGYTVTAGTIGTVTNPITISAYQNFPSVNVSSVTDGSIVSADFGVDYWNKVLASNPSIPTTVAVSAYTNFPQVYVSANGDKTGYALSTTSEDSIVDKVWDEVVGTGVIHNTSGTAGYDVGLLPGINTNVGTAIAGVPTNYLATSGGIVNGTNLAGNYSATWYDDGTNWQVETVGGIGVDTYLDFNLGSTRVSQITINGRFTAGAGRFCNVFAYNYQTSSYNQISDSVTRMNNTGTDTNYTYNLVPANRSSTGAVKIRFYSPSTTNGDDLFLDQVLVKGVEAGATPEDIAQAVYDKIAYTVYDGKVWIDTVNGFSGTDIGIHGIPTYPSNNLADALTIATELGVKAFYIYSKSTITLSQTFDGWVIDGQEYDINLNGQDCTDTIFNFAEINGLATCQAGKDVHFTNCYIENVSGTNMNMRECELLETVTTVSGNHVWDRCIDGTDSNSTPIIEFRDNSTLQIRKYSGGIQLNNMTSANDFTIDGAGRVIIDSSCNGGTVTIRGFFALTNNGTGVTITQDARYNVTQPVGSVTAPITVSAYQNFPQVYVSANGDKIGYTLTSADKAILVDNVWDEILQGSTHNINRSAGRRLRDLGTSVIVEEFLPSQSGAAINEVILDGTASTVDGSYDPAMIVITEGTGSGQTRMIYQYVGATKKATLDRNWKIQPDETSFYQILANPGREHVNEGALRGATANTVTLNTNASSDPHAYIHQIIFLRSGIGEDQVRVVSAYDYTTKIVTTTEPWDTIPTSGTGYVMLPAHVHDPKDYWNVELSSANNPNTFGANVNLIDNIATGSVTVSAYQNFPQVYVSAGNITNVTGNVSGSVNNLVVNPTMTVGEVTVSAYNNFPQVTVSANLDKTDYSISGTKKLLDNLNDIDGTSVTATSIPAVTVGEVTVSAYKNFPQVSVSANSDKTGYTVTAGTVGTVTNGVTVTTNNDKTGYSITANSDKTGYTVTAGTVASVTNPVTINNSVVVSGYENFPQVAVSANNDKTGYSVTANSDKTGYSITANSDKTGYTVTAGTVTSVTNNVNVDTTSIVDSILSATIDTKTFEQVMEILLAMASGKIIKSGSNYAYLKQDNGTTLFTLETSTSARERL